MRDPATSSPRERGSSFLEEPLHAEAGVVLARAGVIPERRPLDRPTSCRPRASGGHPLRPDGSPAIRSSSPRERGSSAVGGTWVGFSAVVPARAGVIRSAASRCLRPHRRPRASGGHPAAGIAPADDEKSSPRERGSSFLEEPLHAEAGVVPARAGVIRHASMPRARWPCRPRASGGHPLVGSRDKAALLSSPRERGSSLAGRDRVRAHGRRPRASGGHPRRPLPGMSIHTSSPRERGSSDHPGSQPLRPRVVPARAGVILRMRRPVCGNDGRPRASGGHPWGIRFNEVDGWSSPRERGSSFICPLCGRGPFVVPARAGVILGAELLHGGGDGRPRASGGHPVDSYGNSIQRASSPRERGSSGNADGPSVHRGVVPARAGVIRECGWSLGASRCRPRASGGHPVCDLSRLPFRRSSPRERGSSRWTPWWPVGWPGRPRASGGHPPPASPAAWCRRSSPRERGSSAVALAGLVQRAVVPARAGVIRECSTAEA